MIQGKKLVFVNIFFLIAPVKYSSLINFKQASPSRPQHVNQAAALALMCASWRTRFAAASASALELEGRTIVNQSPLFFGS